MNISSPYPAEINQIITENYPAIKFVKNNEADIILPLLKSPFRIGEIFDIIDSVFKIGALSIDVAKKTVTCEGKSVDLTEKEIAILQYLSNAKDTVTRDEMIKNIWNYAESVDSKTVENHIYRLRNKISEAFGREIISTENSGYRLIS